MDKRFKRFRSWNFEPEHNTHLLEENLREALIPNYIGGMVLFTITTNPDGTSYVQGYEFTRKREKSYGPSVAN